MRRQCGRSGCSGDAAATFTFDSSHCTVFLDVPADHGARAGDLCTRHARTLVAPRGWSVVDRRSGEPVTVIVGVPFAPPRRAPEPDTLPTRPAARPAVAERAVPAAALTAVIAPPAAPPTASAPPAAVAEAPPAARETSWEPPRFDPGDDLDGLLDARTPLLSRAFGNPRLPV